MGSNGNVQKSQFQSQSQSELSNPGCSFSLIQAQQHPNNGRERASAKEQLFHSHSSKSVCLAKSLTAA